MKVLRLLPWFAALLPALAAGLWASFAGRFPEPWAERQALGEISSRWTFAEWADVQSEPWHVVARVLHLAVLHVSGMTMRWAALANVLLALLLVWCLSGLLRRIFMLGGPARAWARFGVGLMVFSPAFGANWLHGERLGVFLPPLALAAGLALLQRDGRFGWRAALAVGLAGLAPFCHGNGIVAFLALLPALAEAARRSGKSRGVAWIVAALLVGSVAAVYSMRSAGTISLGEGLLAHVTTAPIAAFGELLRATGRLWLDPLPATTFDETVLGACSWLLPLILWRVGDRSEAARRAAAPWWSCVWYGLLVVLWNAERHGLAVDISTWREVTFGAFLLPIGYLGVLAARLGRGLLPLAGGALLVLALQDWHRGIEDLRLARMQVERTEAALLVPETIVGKAAASASPVRDPAQLAWLQQRRWVPEPEHVFESALPAATAASTRMTHGSCMGGTDRVVRGTVRSSLLGDTPQWVVLMATVGESPAVQVGRVQPEFAGRGRDVAWSAELESPLAEGTRVRALGMLVRRGEVVALGPLFVVKNGALAVADAP
ncbi:MAG: hypothetical protein ABIP94_25730 [Planctomycetota bacterium]